MSMSCSSHKNISIHASAGTERSIWPLYKNSNFSKTGPVEKLEAKAAGAVFGEQKKEQEDKADEKEKQKKEEVAHFAEQDAEEAKDIDLDNSLFAPKEQIYLLGSVGCCKSPTLQNNDTPFEYSTELREVDDNTYRYKCEDQDEYGAERQVYPSCRWEKCELETVQDSIHLAGDQEV